MTVRLRFALLYSGAFLFSGLLIATVALFATQQTVHEVNGHTVGPVHVSHPNLYSNASPLEVVVLPAALIVLSLVSGWLLASRLLRPVRALTAAARDISANNLSRRLPVRGRADEFSRLGETLNSLFARLEASFTAQRHFVASASHELRTPLTAERTILQVALADPEAPAPVLREACEQVLELGERTEQLIDGLLTLATGERGIERRDLLDLASIATRVTRAKAGTVPGVRLDTAFGTAPAWGESRLAESLIANLVDNALLYNVPDGWVRVRTGVRDSRPFLTVTNSGPVIPAGEVERLLQPFQRIGSSRVIGPGAGHGLGLAIVAAIAGAHGAELDVRPGADGGLNVDVTFPPAGRVPAAAPPGAADPRRFRRRQSVTS